MHRTQWRRGLPATLREISRRWGLELGDPYQPGEVGWVAPARTKRGEDVVLKVSWRHPEAEHEADGLRLWRGDGAVRLLDTYHLDETTTALLLERCVPGTPLKLVPPEPEQDLIVANLLRRLGKPPPAGHPFRPLTQMCDQWADGFERKFRPGMLDPGLAREGIALFRALPRSAGESVLLCTDLHAGNILASRREPWLMIDPKPYVGDLAYDVLQHMLSCRERLATDPAGLAERMAGLLGLDAERVRLWLFARCVQESPEWISLREVAARLAP